MIPLKIWKIKKKKKKKKKKKFKESNCKANKILIDENSEFYYTLLKAWLQNGDINTYSTYYERKLLVTESVIRTLNDNIYKYLTIYQKIYLLTSFQNLRDNKILFFIDRLKRRLLF